MNRQERRDRTERKWISRLKKLWNSRTFWERINPVKSNYRRGSYYDSMPKAESFEDFKQDKNGVKLKHTGTIWTDNKRLDIQEEHKRNIANRSLSQEDKRELDEAVEEMNNPFAFESYCGACDNFPGDNGISCNKREYYGERCPFRNKFINGEFDANTNWKEIKCENFWD